MIVRVKFTKIDDEPLEGLIYYENGRPTHRATVEQLKGMTEKIPAEVLEDDDLWEPVPVIYEGLQV